jgi:ubiquinone/menaquinone biosynthesis C-methylase UbiE
MKEESSFVTSERERIQQEYQRRAKAIPSDFYAPWQPPASLMLTSRRRIAAVMLHQACVYPTADDQCLEIGCGSLGWLGDLISWGVREKNLHGIELDATRVELARAVLPVADLRLGDATDLPWGDSTFRLVIASTVFTSVLNSTVRLVLAREIVRVLAPEGALLWYDFAVNNPANPHVRKVGRRELKELFPALKGEIRSITLAPPLARFIAPRSWVLATMLEAIPLLRTHLIAVLVKGAKR